MILDRGREYGRSADKAAFGLVVLENERCVLKPFSFPVVTHPTDRLWGNVTGGQGMVVSGEMLRAHVMDRHILEKSKESSRPMPGPE